MKVSNRQLGWRGRTRDLPLLILAALWVGCSSSPTNPKADGGAGAGGHAGAAGGMAGTGHSGGAAGGGGVTGLGGSAGSGGVAGHGGSAGGGGSIAGGGTGGNAGAGGAAGAAGATTDGGTDAALPKDGGQAGAGGAGGAGGAAGTGAAGTGAAGNSGNHDGGMVDGCASGDLPGIGVPVGTVATASSSLSSDATPDKAIDGDTTTRWNSGTYVSSITLTFPAPVAISGVRLHVHASPEATESYTVTSSSSAATLGSWTADVTPQPGLVLPDILVPPGSYSNLTISVNGGISWVAIDAIWLLPFACH